MIRNQLRRLYQRLKEGLSKNPEALTQGILGRQESSQQDYFDEPKSRPVLFLTSSGLQGHVNRIISRIQEEKRSYTDGDYIFYENITRTYPELNRAKRCRSNERQSPRPLAEKE